MSEIVDPTTGEVRSVQAMPAEIVKAVLQVARKVKTLGVDTRNEHARYNYVSIDKFLEVLGPALAEAGLVVLQDEMNAEIRGSADENGKMRSALFVRYAFSLAHESGAFWGPVYRSVALQALGPQSFGAAESYMMKRFMRGLFMVPTGEKDADEEAVHEIPAAAPSGARPAQGNQTAAATNAAPVAASGASAGRAEAQKRHNEMKAALEAATTPGEIADWMISPAWSAMEQAVEAAEGTKAPGILQRLKTFATDRQTKLGTSPEYAA